MKNILEQALEDRFKQKGLEPKLLAGDASNRQFYLVDNDGQTEVLCLDPNKELNRYVNAIEIYKDLKINCPDICLLASDNSYLFMSYGGDLYLNEHPMRGKLEKRCLQEISPLWSSKVQFPLSAMDSPFLMREFARIDQYFNEFHKNNDQLSSEWDKFKSTLSTKLSHSEMNNCHRDFHSRNIMYSGPKSLDPFIIDIQDTRLGPKFYDLASFIVDPYQELSDSLIKELLGTFGIDTTSNEFKFIFWQRGVKAINTYIKMVSDFNKDFYFPCIQKALLNISRLYPDFTKTYPTLYQALWNFQKPL